MHKRLAVIAAAADLAVSQLTAATMVKWDVKIDISFEALKQ